MVEEDRRHPVGGVDYPRTLQEFDEWFPSERRVLNTWSAFAGGMDFDALCAAENPHGDRPEASYGARNASARRLQQQGPYSKVPASHFGRGC